MEIVKLQSDIEKLQENRIYGEAKIIDSFIQFIGKGNVLYCDGEVNITNSTIKFSGSNAVIFLSRSKYNYSLNIVIYNQSLVYFGEDNFINQKLNIVASEGQNVVIGNKGMFSFDCWIRTADAHLIYDSATKKRINNSKGILIGDHVWIGQHVMILKGSEIASGSIIGAASVVSNKRIPSNCIFAGNPLRKIREGVFFSEDSVHMYMDEEILASQTYESNEYIYEHNPSQKIEFSYINEKVKEFEDAEAKVQFAKAIFEVENRNRFSS